MLVRARDLQDIFQTPDAAAILVVIVGLGVCVIAFFGCCGAIQEGKCMLVTVRRLSVSVCFTEGILFSTRCLSLSPSSSKSRLLSCSSSTLVRSVPRLLAGSWSRGRCCCR